MAYWTWVSDYIHSFLWGLITHVSYLILLEGIVVCTRPMSAKTLHFVMINHQRERRQPFALRCYTFLRGITNIHLSATIFLSYILLNIVGSRSRNLGPVSISGKTSYRKITRSLEAARLAVSTIASLWTLKGTSAAVLQKCLSYFRAGEQLWIQISRLRDFTRSWDGAVTGVVTDDSVWLLFAIQTTTDEINCAL